MTPLHENSLEGLIGDLKSLTRVVEELAAELRNGQVPDHSHQKSEVVFDGLSHSHTWTADNGPWMRLYHTHPVGSALHRHDDLEAVRHLLGAGQ